MDAECRKSIISEDYADFSFQRGLTFDDVIRTTNSCFTELVGDFMSVYMPLSQVPEDVLQAYGYGAIPNCYGVLDAASAGASGVYKVRNNPNLSLTGKGVLIGIVDTGIDYTLDTFRYPDGTSKIYAIWDQSIYSENQMPEGFMYGTEYTREQINDALKSTDPLSIVPSIDTNRHGTQLAGIAAGNEDADNEFTGVAPDAELLIVKLKPAKKYLRDFWRIPDNIDSFQKNDLIYGVKYLVEKAAKVGKAISIVIGIGTSQGAHDDKGALSKYLSTAAAFNGVSITIAGGNEGNRKLHYSGTVQSPDYTNMFELNVANNEPGFTMEIWGETPGVFSIEIISPSGERIPRIYPGLNISRTINFIFERTVIELDYLISEEQSGVQLAMLRFTAPSEGVWRFYIFSSDTLTMLFHVWLPIYQFVKEGTFFLKPDADYTLTSPANVAVPIVVTAYDCRNGSIYVGASRGYTRDNFIQPSFAAPGVNMIVPGVNNTYVTASGTSFAAAHMGGVAAIFLEWGKVKEQYPAMSGVQIKNFLIRGAIRSKDLSYPNKVWGYGIMDVYNAFVTLGR